MSNMIDVLLLFILVGGLILVLMLFRSDRGRGQIKVGKAELLIDFENSRDWVKGGRRPEPGRPQPPPSDYFLSVKGSDWSFPLHTDPVYIGRKEGSQIRLRDRSAAMQQAVIYRDGGRYRINNLSTQPPTLVNNRPITTQFLGDGNTIQLGRTRLIFRKRRS